MAVNLKLIPPAGRQPASPASRAWLIFLLAALAAAAVKAIFIDGMTTDLTVDAFCEQVLTFPLLLWLGLLLPRLIWFRGQQIIADAGDEAREQALQQAMLRGRRSLQVLACSLYSALREPADTRGEAQRKALRHNAQAIKTQASWHSEEGVRHSRLAREKDETPEQLLSRTLSQMLAEMRPVLADVPADRPLALLVESSGNLPQSRLQAVWQACWAASGIGQSVTPVAGSGFAAIDNWLDEQSHERALLLIVACQIDPERPENSAEAVVGLLLENSSVPTGLKPLVRLHRPEQAQQTAFEDLRYALAQSLDWVPINAENVTEGWLTGIEARWHPPLATALAALSFPITPGRNLHDTGSMLGYPGAAAPWLAVACATENRHKGAPQLIVTGNGTAEAPLWFTIVTPG